MSSTTTTTTSRIEAASSLGEHSQSTSTRQAGPSASPAYKYERFLPTFDPSVKRPALTPFEHKDPGLEALKHPDPRSFLRGAKVEDLTPRFGSEVEGIQLHKLTKSERQQLALFVAQRGVVAFRDQDFIDQDPNWQLYDFGATFGRLHEHPTSGSPAEFPEFHLVYRDGQKTLNHETSDRFTSSAWHSDVTYELQPPGITFLFLYDSPETGGDTIYSDQRAAWNHLSPTFREVIENLKVVHSGVEQANLSRNKGERGGIVKREPVETAHPIVRTHPVTGEKSLFVNQQFCTKIVGMKREESDTILNMLHTFVATSPDIQTRVRWKPRTVVAWDNRICNHSAIVDFAEMSKRRHGARITPQAERPFYRK